MSDWLRRDIGLTEDVVKSALERLDHIRQRHSGWL